jgi:succinate-acetate transporter protein
MSVASETDVQAAAAAEAAAAAGNNPVLLGIPCFVVGGLTLGLFLLGYQPDGGAGPLLTNAIFVAGLGLLIAAIWAIRVGAGAVAGIFGVFAAFWWSFAVLLLGIGGTPKTDALQSFTLYSLVWTIVVVVLTLAALRLPVAFSLLIALVAVALLLVFLFYAGGGTATGLTKIAGIVALAFSAIGVYITYDAFNQALGGRALPLGPALVK